MPIDPSRRPSSNRVRLDVQFDAMVWLECDYCCGDGWHYAGHPLGPGGKKSLAKIPCGICDGKGATQVAAICCGPNSRIVPAPSGWAAIKTGS